jgi:hypothetical protein
VEAKLCGATKQLVDADPNRLPMRELPHGNMAGLYLQFVAYCKSTGESACSKTLFYEVGKEWHTCLRFHKKSNHAVCAVCSELRAQIRRCTEPRLILIMFFLVVFRPAPCALGHLCPSTLSHHMAAEDFVRHAHLCDELLGHFTQQYRDRELYYLARERSRGRKDLLTIIVDSYDKAKIVLPKFPHGGRNPKKRDYEKSRRPSVLLGKHFDSGN